MSEQVYTELQFEQDTQDHVRKVRENLIRISKMLMDRAMGHDDSKFSQEERELFIEYTPKLKNVTYGSEEYKQFLKELKPALDHHYAKNDHHSEHYKNGIDDMHLVALIEMFVDWFASCQRHNDGNIRKSIAINKERYKLSDQLVSILENTAVLLENNNM